MIVEPDDVAFYERVRAAYLDRAETQADRYLVVNADQALTTVEAELHRHLDELLEKCAVGRNAP